MWLIFDSIELQSGLKSKRTGATYDAYVIKGEKKGFQDEPNTPYEKKVFPDSSATIIEQGIERPNLGIVPFFQKAVAKGDTVIIKFRRTAGGWDIESLENLHRKAPDYQPLSQEEIAAHSAAQQATASPAMTPPWVR